MTTLPETTAATVDPLVVVAGSAATQLGAAINALLGVTNPLLDKTNHAATIPEAQQYQNDIGEAYGRFVAAASAIRFPTVATTDDARSLVQAATDARTAAAAEAGAKTVADYEQARQDFNAAVTRWNSAKAIVFFDLQHVT